MPFDAAPIDFQFKPPALPANFDNQTFYAVYASAVANPGHLYIQFQEDDNSPHFKNSAIALE